MNLELKYGEAHRKVNKTFCEILEKFAYAGTCLGANIHIWRQHSRYVSKE